jgi:hypothetical protein
VTDIPGVFRDGARILRDPQGTLVKVDPQKATALLEGSLGGKRFRDVTEQEVLTKDIEATNSTLGARSETFGRSMVQGAGDLATTLARPMVRPIVGAANLISGAVGGEQVNPADVSRAVNLGPAGLVAGLGQGDLTSRLAASDAYNRRTAELAQTNPGTAMVGNVVGQLTPMLLGSGPVSAASKGLGAAMGGSALARAAGAGLAYGAEGALYGAASAETEARMAGQTDGASAEQLLSHIGLATLLGGGLGATGSLLSSGGRAISSKFRELVDQAGQRSVPAGGARAGEDAIARMQSNIHGEQFYETIRDYGAHNNSAEAVAGRKLWARRDELIDSKVSPMAKDLQAIQDAMEPVTEIVRNPSIRKNIVESLPEASRPAAKQAGIEALNSGINEARNLLEQLPVNSYTKSSRASLQRFIDHGTGQIERLPEATNAHDINAIVNATKQEAQKIHGSLVDTMNLAKSGEERHWAKVAAREFENKTQEPLRQHLMDTSIWGKAGEAQREINRGWIDLLQDRGILKRFQREFFQEGEKSYETGRRALFADTAKVKGWLDTTGTVAGETRQAVSREALDAIDNLTSTIGKYHELTPARAEHLTALKSAASRVRTALKETDETVGVANKIDALRQAEKTGMGQIITPATAATTGAILGGPLGAAAGLGISFLARPGTAIGASEAIRSMLGRFGAKLPEQAGSWVSTSGGIKKAGAATVRAIATGTRAASRVSIPTAMQVFQGKAASLDDAYDKRLNQLVVASQNPDQMLEGVARTTGGLADIDPRLAGALVGKMQTAVDYLLSKAPGSTLDPTVLQPGRKSAVSSLDKLRFARLWAAIEKPETVISDLRRGMATPDQLEALKVVHPETYNAIRASVMAAIVEVDHKGGRLPIAVRSQLDALLDLGGAGIPALGPEIAGRIQMLEAKASEKTPIQKKAPNLLASVKMPQSKWPSVKG